MRPWDEFVCIWFETPQLWVVIGGGGRMIERRSGTIGDAVSAGLNYFRASEADFEIAEQTGTFYRYIRSDIQD
jgi:hypothetical protein